MQGRPKDGPEDKFRLTPVVPRLQELLGVKVNRSPVASMCLLKMRCIADRRLESAASRR